MIWGLDIIVMFGGNVIEQTKIVAHHLKRFAHYTMIISHHIMINATHKIKNTHYIFESSLV